MAEAQITISYDRPNCVPEIEILGDLNSQRTNQLTRHLIRAIRTHRRSTSGSIKQLREERLARIQEGGRHVEDIVKAPEIEAAPEAYVPTHVPEPELETETVDTAETTLVVEDDTEANENQGDEANDKAGSIGDVEGPGGSEGTTEGEDERSFD